MFFQTDTTGSEGLVQSPVNDVKGRDDPVPVVLNPSYLSIQAVFKKIIGFMEYPLDTIALLKPVPSNLELAMSPILSSFGFPIPK